MPGALGLPPKSIPPPNQPQPSLLTGPINSYTLLTQTFLLALPKPTTSTLTHVLHTTRKNALLHALLTSPEGYAPYLSSGPGGTKQRKSTRLSAVPPLTRFLHLITSYYTDLEVRPRKTPYHPTAARKARRKKETPGSATGARAPLPPNLRHATGQTTLEGPAD